MLPSKKRDLPSWARLIKPRDVKNLGRQELSIMEEEQYLRTKCYHSLCRQLDIQFYDALQAIVPLIPGSSNHASSSSALDRDSPEVKAPLTNTGRGASPGSSESNDDGDGSDERAKREQRRQYFSLEPIPLPTSLPAVPIIEESEESLLMLPVVVVSGPYHRLDRLAYVQHYLACGRRSGKSVGVWLLQQTSTLSDLNSYPSDDLIRELVRQCLQHRSNGDSTRQRHHLSKASSLTDLLVSWAKHTASYQEITIYLDVSNHGFYSSHLQSFLHWLSDRRARYGLPFSVVLLRPSHDVFDLQVQSASYGPIHWNIRHISLPTSQDILYHWWDRVTEQQLFPFVIPPCVWHQITVHQFESHHGSAIQIVARIKQLLARALSIPGSFWAVAAAGHVCDEWNRMAWFLFDENGREAWCQHNDDDAATSEQRCPSRKLTQQWIQRLQHQIQVMLVTRRVERMFQQRTWLEHSSSPTTTIALTKELLRLLSELRHQCAATATIQQKAVTPLVTQRLDTILNSDTASKSTVNFINRLIVLIGRGRDASTELPMYFQSLMKEWENLQYTYCRRLPDDKRRLLVSNPICYANLNPQPRRDTFAGLLYDAPPKDDYDSGDNSTKAHQQQQQSLFLAGTVYGLIRDNVSIAQSDWFHLWHTEIFVNNNSWDSCADSADDSPNAERQLVQSSFHRFWCGIFQLLYLGLIRERHSTSKKCKGIVFDKTILVWFGGD